jgi:hypothetical protein
MTSTIQNPSRSLGLWALGIAIVVVAVVPHVPVLSLLVRPLVWLSTLMHEAGHGLVSLVVGAGCKSLEISMDASGVMISQRGAGGPWKDAAISLGGLIGPAIASAGFCVAGIVPTLARASFVVVGAACLAIAGIYAEGFATVVCMGWGAFFIATGVWLRGTAVRTAALVFAVNLALAVFSRSDYLFTDTAGSHPSDVAQMATALGGHYFLWGIVAAAISVLLLVVGLLLFFGGEHVRMWWMRKRAS